MQFHVCIVRSNWVGGINLLRNKAPIMLVPVYLHMLYIYLDILDIWLHLGALSVEQTPQTSDMVRSDVWRLW